MFDKMYHNEAHGRLARESNYLNNYMRECTREVAIHVKERKKT